MDLLLINYLTTLKDTSLIKQTGYFQNSCIGSEEFNHELTIQRAKVRNKNEIQLQDINAMFFVYQFRSRNVIQCEISLYLQLQSLE